MKISDKEQHSFTLSLFIVLKLTLLFDSGNAVLGEAFTPPPTLRKRIKKVVSKPNRLSPNVNEFLVFGQLVFCFLYAHHSIKTNKKL
jgi:hypothetical protein